MGFDSTKMMAYLALLPLILTANSNAYQLNSPTAAISKFSAKQIITLMHETFGDNFGDVVVRDDGVTTSYQYDTHVLGKRFRAHRDISVAMFPWIGIVVKDFLPGVGVTVNMHLKETSRSRETVALDAKVNIEKPAMFTLVPNFIVDRILKNRMKNVEKLFDSL